jgi:hypothetical protein
VAVRIKSQWHDEDSTRTLEEIGGAIAYNAWKLALDKAVTLHGEHFVYENDGQRLAVIAEYLIFLAQVVDRLTSAMLEDDERRTLITALVLKMADHMDENAQSLLGDSDHRSAFIERFNLRSGEYAEFSITDDGPSYPFLRHLGYEIQQVMGDSQENRWVIDQVMDMDGPEVFKQMKRIVRNLFM